MQQLKLQFSRQNMKRECATYMHICIFIYFKSLCVSVPVYVYTYIWIRIIQVGKPLWRWSCLIPGKTAQPDCSGPCPVKSWALPDVKKFSWLEFSFLHLVTAASVLPPCTSEDSLTYARMSTSADTHVCTYKHTHKVSFVLPLCIWEITSKWSLALAQCSYSCF